MIILASSLSDIQRAIRDHFQQGGSAAATFTVLLVILTVFLAALIATRWQDRVARHAKADDPKRLFDDLIRKLNLPPRQGVILQRIATASSLRHPTVLLLSPVLFQAYAQKWQATAANKSSGSPGAVDNAAETARELVSLKRTLFPRD